MLGKWKDAQFAMVVAAVFTAVRTLKHGTLLLRATHIIRELKYAKLRAHKSMHIVILWSESVNESTIDQKSVLDGDGKNWTWYRKRSPVSNYASRNGTNRMQMSSV